MSDYTIVHWTGIDRGFSVPSTVADFTLFGVNVEIKFYGVLIAIGYILALIVCHNLIKKNNGDEDFFFDAIITGTIFAVIGARLFFVLFKLDYYLYNPKEILLINEGGLAIYGGIIGAVLSVWILSKIKKKNILPLIDVAGIGFLIGQGIGRWGNYTNQEAFGTNTKLPWGMFSEKTYQYLADNYLEITSKGIEIDPSQPVHPTFLYESIWCILGAIILYIAYKKFKKFDGQIALMYCIWYGFERMIVEGFRTDSLFIGNTNVRVSQLISGIIFVVGLIALIVLLIKKNNKRKVINETN
ncbi:MAG: prolipoprotein diacylglyceryl transferase [Clostridia bacterium]|nr:prolipoprotein diacylglyceryl transferase [Clostridia bacterium]